VNCPPAICWEFTLFLNYSDATVFEIVVFSRSHLTARTTKPASGPGGEPQGKSTARSSGESCIEEINPAFRLAIPPGP
jgi:hypothetical protein